VFLFQERKIEQGFVEESHRLDEIFLLLFALGKGLDLFQVEAKAVSMRFRSIGHARDRGEASGVFAA
jgi:hypothetical protein